MGLSIVHGPPNSGRAGVIRERFAAAIGRDPVLVVPTLDDVFSFGRELCPKGGALLGGTVTTFAGLFREVAQEAGADIRPELTTAQRLGLIGAAPARSDLRLLRASSARPGFAPALDELLGELQAWEIGPDRLLGSAADLGASAVLAEVAELYRTYMGLRDQAGRGDAHLSAAAAIAALRSDPGAWRRRPVLVYGFDDLTQQQLSLVQTLAPVTEVTVGVTYEEREALAARSGLLARLRDTTDRDPDRDQRTKPEPGNTRSSLLYHLERSFLSEESEPTPPDGSLTLLRCAGERSEAEIVGGEVARLLAAGADAGEVAIAVRDPGSRGPLLGRVLSAYGIPVAVEGDLPASATATGAALAGLLRAAGPDGAAADLLAYLRAPGRAAGASVDSLERWLRRRGLPTAIAAEERWTEMGGRGLEPLHALRETAGDGRAALRLAADSALDLSQWPLKREGRQGQVAEPDEALELRAGSAISDALLELAELDACLPGPTGLADVVLAISLPLWSGPISGRVRIASPYRLRAARFRHVFVVSLQDGEFPSQRSGGPFLSDEQRKAAGLRERADSEAEERYLFHVCLSLPTHSLSLSHRYCDDEGTTLAPSPYLDDVRAQLSPAAPAEGSDPLEALWRTRSLSEVVFDPSDAPSEAELARSLAAAHDTFPAPGLELSEERTSELGERLGVAVAFERCPGPLREEAVLAELAERSAFGGTTLEEFATCSYRWFVNHELDPSLLEPDPEPLAHGGAVHKVLEELYRHAPTPGTRPDEGTIDAWVSRGRELLEARLGERTPEASATARIGRRRVHGLLEDYLRRDAARADAFETAMLEARFGFGGDEDPGALRFGDWELHGSIDRVDIDPARGLALVHDYKLSREVVAHGAFDKKKRLQLALYLRAVERVLGRRPIAGLYQPLGAGMRGIPRGLGLREERDETLDSLGLHDRDWVPEEKFEARLAMAEETASQIVGRMRKGDITRDPLEHECPRYCTFAPICRIDRRTDTESDPLSAGGGER